VTPNIYAMPFSFPLATGEPNGNTMNPLRWQEHVQRQREGRASLAKGEAPALTKGAGRQHEEQPGWTASQNQSMGSRWVGGSLSQVEVGKDHIYEPRTYVIFLFVFMFVVVYVMGTWQDSWTRRTPPLPPPHAEQFPVKSGGSNSPPPPPSKFCEGKTSQNWTDTIN
jgi:hypothetical protein